MTHSINGPDPIEDMLAALRADDPEFTDAELDSGFTKILIGLEHLTPERTPHIDEPATEPEQSGAPDEAEREACDHSAPASEPPAIADRQVPAASHPQGDGMTSRATESGSDPATGQRAAADQSGSLHTDVGRAARTRLRFDPGRRLRALIGIDEDLLSRVGFERSRYTALGGAVLGSCVISALSMWSMATQALGTTSAVAWVITIIWALCMLNLDRLFVAERPNRRRVGPLLMRLLIALLVGTVIAEPLLLRTFETDIKEHVALEHASDSKQLYAGLIRCNPVPPEPESPTPPKDCTAAYTVSFGTAADGQLQELSTLRSNAGSLQERVDRDAATLWGLDSSALVECRRLIRDPATDTYQTTPTCLRLRERAQTYRTTHHIDENRMRLAGMESRAAQIQADLTGMRSALLKTRADGIHKRMNEERSSQKQIGILERMQALEDMASRDVTLLLALWVMRLLLVLLGVLPVLVTYLGGQTAYDRLRASSHATAVRMHSEEVWLAQRQTLAELKMAQDAIEQQIQRHRAESVATSRDRTVRELARVGPAGDALEEENGYSSTV
ncbi:DUF4407 domain-containing protein [Streptomyces sp. SLBN-8D4]|uniref:DUF4407 domain-containing protein n=1 Tax=Streptomyces sp. SLBN-8D4 TaxID=3377728 RepID=UPI003C7BA622